MHETRLKGTEAVVAHITPLINSIMIGRGLSKSSA